MATYLFRSPLAPRLQAFLEARHPGNRRGVTTHKILRYLDRFLMSELKPGQPLTREVAERCLGHRLPGVEGIYNTHDYFDERREALTQWTALLLDAEHGERKVTAIGRRKAM